MKKLLTAFLTAVLAIGATFAFAACGDPAAPSGGNNSPSVEETINNHEHHYDSREICTICGYTENGTEGLEYRYFDVGCYYVDGIGTAEEKDIIIPSVYDDGEHGKFFVRVSSYAFDKADITSVVLGYGIQFVYNGAFRACGELISATLPASIKSINSWVFSGCSKLENVTIPNSITDIETESFYNCSALTNVTVPDSVTTVGYAAFGGCVNLMQTESGVKYVDKWAVDYEEGIISVSLRSGTVGIGDSAFSGCSSLTSIVIPYSVANIGDSAFQDCAGLTEIDIPDSVTTLSPSVFFGCTGLTCIVIPDGVKSIGAQAFYGSGLTDITIPDSVTIIGAGAFVSCELTVIRFEGTTAQWNAIEKLESWDNATGDYFIHCKDGVIDKED